MTVGLCPKGLKVGYPTAEAALVALEEVRLARRGGKVERRVYLCSRCEQWHLTASKTWRA